MSFFQEIKDLFTNEIVNSPQYQVALKIKDLMIADILSPNINFSFNYILKDDDFVDLNNKEYEHNVIILCLNLILGFEVEKIDNGINKGISIIMKNFLQTKNL